MIVKEFKIRCSAIGEIMSGEIGLTSIQESRINELQQRRNGVGKPLTPNMDIELDKLIDKRDNPELPKGAKSYCKTWLKKTLFKRDEQWKSVVIDKGLACEQEGIDLISKVYELEGLFKNEDFFSNDFCQGSPDILHSETVRDIKNSWDLFTFPMFDDELNDKDYWWQLQGYMMLTGIQTASLDYVLIDTPMPLVLLDLKKLYYQSGGVAEEWTQQKYEYLYPNYRFDDIPLNMRVKSYTFNYESWIEEQISYRVDLCRAYIKLLLTNK